MHEDNQGPLPPYQPTPNVPPPPTPHVTPPPPSASGFGTVTPGTQPYDAPAQGGFGAPGPNPFPPEKKKSRLGLILGVAGAAFVLLVIAGIILFVMFFRALELDDLADLADDATIEDTVSSGFTEGNTITIDGQIDQGRFDLIEITLTEGQGVLVTALQGTSPVDTILTIRDPNGVQVARNDDAVGADLPSTFDSQVRFTANTTGTFSIELSDFGNNTAGSYQVIIEDG